MSALMVLGIVLCFAGWALVIGAIVWIVVRLTGNSPSAVDRDPYIERRGRLSGDKQ